MSPARSGVDVASAGFRRYWDHVRRHLRLAARSLRQRPGFVVIVVLTLGTGIGANVAVYGVANLALFHALPFPDADRLVMGRSRWPDGSVSGTVSGPDYYDLREQARSFEALGAMTPFRFEAVLTGSGDPARIPVGFVTPGLLSGILGARPALGRDFQDREGEPGAPATVLVSHRFWQDRLGGAANVVGAAVTLNGMPQTVIGIMPPYFRFLTDAEVWAPLVRGEGFMSGRQFHNVRMVGRLRPEVTLAQAAAETDLIAERLARAYPASNQGMGLVLTGLRDTMVEGFRSTVVLLMTAVALVLLVACGNVASLLLARGATRRAEMALRSALGATPGMLARQLLAESAILGVAAAAAGTAVALMLQRSLVSLTPLARYGLDRTGIQPGVLLFAVGLALVAVLAFGLAPALATARVQPADELRFGARSVGPGSRARLRSALVVAQVTISMMLLVGAGLLLRSVDRLRHVDPGFESRNLLTAELGLSSARYQDPQRRVQFFSELVDRVTALPGVQQVGLVNGLPIRRPAGDRAAWDVASPPPTAADAKLAIDRTVMPGYFAAMGIPVLAGRDARRSDDAAAPRVVVISGTMARTLFGDQNPLGRLIGVDGEPAGTAFEVVGVVGDVRVNELASAPPMAMYFPYAQRSGSSLAIAIRSAAEPAALANELRRLVRELDADVPVASVATMDEVLSESVSFNRAVATVIALAAGFALFLAAVGLYGVLAYFVAERNREIAVRIALGASGAEVVRLVVTRGFALVGLGLALGLVGALSVTRVIRGFMFEIAPSDPVTLGGVLALLSTIGLAACLIPAWRAWRVDPAQTFRSA